ncbi:MAG: carbon starvation protein [Bacteroidetes bacterium]|nr:carbon starvation protein [Bacteroidota bacterium]
MISFVISILLLIAGYAFYGRLSEKIFGIDPAKITPAIATPDGVDYVPLPWWKIFLIQFLNIAGLGPIFGAIMGIMFGQAAFLWIVIGTIFAGGVHDFFSGMMSVRSNGASLPELIGKELGQSVKQFMRLFSLLLMILVGAVFVSGPAGLLANLTSGAVSVMWWSAIIFTYYILATLLPIDKLIGKIYPIFGFALLFMAVGILSAMFINKAPIPEFTSGFANMHPQKLPIFPIMFVSIACGAISGFHATQSPLMARCIQNERLGRRIFYGSMVAEGIVALIWAAAASSFFGSIEGLQHFVAGLAPTVNKPAVVVDLISKTWLGQFGGILALLGVIAAPLTSGDTALRSARLIAADFLKLDQKPVSKRLLISIPLFVLTFLVLQMNFDILWRYFAWCNQTLAVFTLWAITVYLAKQKKWYGISLMPAMFMTAVSISYILMAPEGFALKGNIPVASGIIASILLFALFFHKTRQAGRFDNSH